MQQQENGTSSRPVSDRFPRILLLSVGALMTVTFALAAAGRISKAYAPPTVESPTVAERELRFEDRPDGSIAVFDATSGLQIDNAAPGTNGFLRGTLRGLARERKRESIGQSTPFKLSAHADGYLILTDPTTGRTVNLGSFGPTNAEVFARMLHAPGAHISSASEDANPTTFAASANPSRSTP